MREDAVEYAQERQTGSVTFPLRLGMGSFDGRELMGERTTASIEDIWCEKIRGCSYAGRGASYSMSAMLP